MAPNRKKEWTTYKPIALDIPLAYSYLSAVLQALAAVPSFSDIFQAHREEFKEGPMNAALRHFLYLAHTVPQDYLVEPRGILRLLERRDGRFGVRTSQDPAEAFDIILGSILEEVHSVENQSVLAPRFSRFGGILALPNLEAENWHPSPDRNITKVVFHDSSNVQKHVKTSPIEAATKAENDFQDFQSEVTSAPVASNANTKQQQEYLPLKKPAKPAHRISSIATPRGYRILHEELERIPEPVPKKEMTAEQKAMMRAFGMEIPVKEPAESAVLDEKTRWCPLEEVAVRGQFKKLMMGATVWAVTCNKTGTRIPTSYLAHFLLPVPVAFEKGMRHAKSIEECLRQMSTCQPFDGSGKLWSPQSIRWHRLLRHVGSVRVELEHLPRVLMLQLSRFKKMKDGSMPKVAPRVQFSETLDISDIVAPHLENRDLTYKLVSVIAHLGSALEDPSMYEAYVRSGDNTTWYRTCCNVSHPVDLNHVLLSDAYILVYEKCDFTWNDHIAQSEVSQEHVDLLKKCHDVEFVVNAYNRSKAKR